MMAAAFSAFAAGLQHVVVVGEGPAAEALLDAAGDVYRPFSMVLRLTPDAQRDLAELVPFLAGMHLVEGQPATYISSGLRLPRPGAHARGPGARTLGVNPFGFLKGDRTA